MNWDIRNQGHRTGSGAFYLPTLGSNYLTQPSPISYASLEVLCTHLPVTHHRFLLAGFLTVPAGPGTGSSYLSMSPAELCEVSPTHLLVREEYIVNFTYSEFNHALVMVAKWEGPWWVSEKRGGITLYKLLVIKQS